MNEATRLRLESVIEQRRGNYMRTFTGAKFWPMDPRPEDMHIEDVAHHLALQCRFNGATKSHYSVAEHCVLGSYLIPQEFAFEFLMHDRAETWLGDLIRPLKVGTLIGEEYKTIEAQIEIVSAQKWNLPLKMPAEVKRVDETMCRIELAKVFEHPLPWSELGYLVEAGVRGHRIGAAAAMELSFWDWRQAEQQFLLRFEDLQKLRAVTA